MAVRAEDFEGVGRISRGMSRPKIIISGYYGYGNAGDEAILASLVQAISAEVRDAEFCVLSGNAVETRRALGVRAVQGKNLFAVVTELIGASLLVSGGGGLLQDTTGPRSVLYYLSVVSLARKLRKPVMFYAQGIGPVRGARARKMVGRVASRVQLITVRDVESKLQLEEMGVKGPPVVVTADPVLGLEPCAQSRVDEILRAESCGIGEDAPRVVGLSIRPWTNAPDIHDHFVALGRVLVERGYRVLVMPFQQSQDRVICEQVEKAIGSGAQTLRGEYDPTALMGICGRLHAVVGMRLHALIFAAAQGVPVAGVAYDPKVANFLRRIEAPTVSLQGLQSSALIEAALDAVLNAVEHRQRLLRTVPLLRDEARSNARLLRALLDGKGRLDSPTGPEQAVTASGAVRANLSSAGGDV